MGKKHKGYKPQKRRRLKPTTGTLQLVDVIYMDKERTPDPENPNRKKDNVFAACTCGEWRSSPEAVTFSQIGEEAKRHVDESGHQFRYHAERDDLSEEDIVRDDEDGDPMEQGDAGSDQVGDESGASV